MLLRPFTNPLRVSGTSANELPQAIHLENASNHDRTAMYYAPDGESTPHLVIYSDGQFTLVADDYVSFVLSGVQLLTQK